MTRLRFKVDPAYLAHQTEIENPVSVRITQPDSAEIKAILGESGRAMARDGALFIFEKELAIDLVVAGVAEILV